MAACARCHGFNPNPMASDWCSTCLGQATPEQAAGAGGLELSSSSPPRHDGTVYGHLVALPSMWVAPVPTRPVPAAPTALSRLVAAALDYREAPVAENLDARRINPDAFRYPDRPQLTAPYVAIATDLSVSGRPTSATALQQLDRGGPPDLEEVYGKTFTWVGSLHAVAAPFMMRAHARGILGYAFGNSSSSHLVNIMNVGEDWPLYVDMQVPPVILRTGEEWLSYLKTMRANRYRFLVINY
jgi:hypothetical protein